MILHIRRLLSAITAKHIRIAALPVILLVAASFLFWAKDNASAQYAPAIDGAKVSGAALTLAPGTPILIGADESEALQKAATDLQRDMKSVLGQTSPIIRTLAAAGNQSAIIITHQSAATAQFRDSTLTGEEVHQVTVRTLAGQNHVVLQGADLRGSLYAIYSFSDKFVGVPPLWYWSDWQPETKSNIQIPKDGGFRVASPQTKNRAWFLNNQDLILSSWRVGTKEYEFIYETMLRLKLNTLYLGEDIGQYGGADSSFLRIAKNAQARGLKIAANSLATFRTWDDYWLNIKKRSSVPALSLANQSLYEEYWRHSLQFAKSNDLDIMWVLGFRGRGDQPFWESVSGSPTSATARGDVIEQQVARQAALVRQVTGNQHPEMAFLIWNELSDLTVQGALQLPQDADITWIFSNDIRDHFPMSDVRTYSLPASQSFGYYMNLQFYSSGSHLVEGEGPWKMAQNFKVVQNRRPNGRLNFAYVNIGNIREFLISGTSSARMMWNINAYDTNADMPLIMGRYFGESNGVAVTSLYRSMLDAYWKQKKATQTDIERQYIFHDLRLSLATTRQIDQIIVGKRKLNISTGSEEPIDRLGIDIAHNGASSDVGAIMIGSQAAQNNFKQVAAAVDAKLSDIPTSQQQFYKDVLQSPAHFLYQSHRMLYTVTRSHFKIESSKPEAYCSLLDAKDAAQAMRAALAQTAHTKFAQWYANENLFGVGGIQARIDQGLTTLPKVACAGSPLAPAPPAADKGDLVVKKFVLTNSQGVEKTSFLPGEAIYPKVILANQGTATVVTPTGNTFTHFYSHAPTTVAKGSPSDVNVSLQNGQFTRGFEKEYGASNTGPNTSFYKGAKSWTKTQAGTYTARVYMNAFEHGEESTFANNQLTVTYTIAPSVTQPPSPPTPTPPTPQPPQPTGLSVNAFPSDTSFSTSSVRDGKRTAFRAMRTMTLNRLSCYGCGSGTTFTLRKSSSSYAMGEVIYTGTAQGTTSSWSYVDVNIPVTGGHYFVLEFTPSSVPVYFKSTQMNHTDFQFHRYATAGAPTWKAGSWQIGLGYTK